jgi:hypothetical protein
MRKLLLFIGIIILQTQMPAQTAIPQAMKYQAVLHDLAGNTLANETGISIRVNILKNNSTGQIVYSEVHDNISTNAFGVINLEIGKGVPEGRAFSNIDWGSAEHYVRIEMSTGGGGYTEMGVSQLLSVPYALYAAEAGNASSGAGQVFTLSDKAIPRYNQATQNLANSGMYANADDSITINGVLTIQKAGNVATAYTFPSEKGVSGDVIVLDASGRYSKWSPFVTDSIRALRQSLTVVRDTVNVLRATSKVLQGTVNDIARDLYNYAGRNNGEIAYWDETTKRFVTTPGITYKATGDTVRIYDYAMPKTATGKQNTFVMVNAKGNALEFKQLKTKGPVSFIGDTIVFDTTGIGRSGGGGSSSGGESYWEKRLASKQIYSKGRDTVNVGIGTYNPQSLLHVDSGHVFFAGRGLGDDAQQIDWALSPVPDVGNGFLWNHYRSALRVGGTDIVGLTSWRNDKVKKYTIGLGLNANPMYEGAQVFGEGSKAWGKYSFVLGSESMAWGNKFFAIGNMNQVFTNEDETTFPSSPNFDNLFAIGANNTITPVGNSTKNIFALGVGNTLNLPEASEYNVVLGHINNIIPDPSLSSTLEYNTTNSIIIGNTFKQHFGFYKEYDPAVIYKEKLVKSIAIGNGIILSGENNIAIGTHTKFSTSAPPVARSIGEKNITIGYNVVTTQSNDNISIGTNNYTEGKYNDAVESPGPVLKYIGVDNSVNSHPGSITIGKNILSDVISVDAESYWSGGSDFWHGGPYRGGNITIGQSELKNGVGMNGMFNVLIGSGIEKSKAEFGGEYYNILSHQDVVFETTNPNAENTTAGTPATLQNGQPAGLITTGGTVGTVNIGVNNYIGREGMFSITMGSGNQVGEYGRERVAQSASHYSHGITIGNGLIYSSEHMSDMGGIILGNRNELTHKGGTNKSVFVIAHGKVRTESLLSGSPASDISAVYGSRRTGANLFELDEAGNIYINGNPFTPSDKRLKKDIKKIEVGFAPLKELKTYSYKYIDDMPDSQQTKFGFMAQDVQKFFPELIMVGSDGLLSMNYVGFIPILWDYTQKLQKQVEEQEAEIELLKDQIAEIKKLLIEKLSK